MAARLSTVLNASSGGVGAKMLSSPGRLISRATSLDLYFGSASSALFVSTHFTEMGALPILIKASTLGRLCHTPLVSKYLSSSALAARTSAGMSGCPVTASR